VCMFSLMPVTLIRCNILFSTFVRHLTLKRTIAACLCYMVSLVVWLVVTAV